MKRLKHQYAWMMMLLPLLSSCGNGNHQSDAYGNFESTEIIISAEAAGKVIAINVEEGDNVNAGDVICQMDTVPLWLQKQQLIAGKESVMSGLRKVTTAIEVQKAQRQMLEKDLVRLEKMKAENAATAKQYDDATGQMDVINRQIDNTRAQLDGIQAELALADAKIATLNDQLSRCTVKASEAGTILSKLTENGELLTMGRPIVKMAHLDPMILRAYISGDMLPQVKIGSSVKVLIDRDGSSNDTIPGTISWVSSSAEFTPKIIQTKQERVNQVYAFKVTVPNDGRIKIGMPGEVVLIK